MRKSKGECGIIKFLKRNKIKYISEKSFVDCRSPKNRMLRFDFFLPDYNMLIEYQGQHHYMPVNKYRRAKVVHDMTVIHDQIKKQYTIEKRFAFLTIDYKNFKKLDLILFEELL